VRKVISQIFSQQRVVGGEMVKEDFGNKGTQYSLRGHRQLHPVSFHQLSYIGNQIMISLSSDKPKLPLLRMLRGVCKLFDLNELELVYWGILNQLSQWGANV
jgi:hypothetical protein